MLQTQNLRIVEFSPLVAPRHLEDDLPATPEIREMVQTSRQAISTMLRGHDERRLLVIVGPCSIHDPEAALDYAKHLRKLADATREHLLIVMRTYFEKPRTVTGWKGLISDPRLDGSCDIHFGLALARKLLVQINEMGLPCATEFLDTVVPHYLADLVTWAAIGARTAESQVHRQMASGLSMPVGFKNSTDGSLQTAVNAVLSAQSPHAFLGINADGLSSVVRTTGNPDCHIVLRGGATGSNY
ncbi:MAG: 3-deoxy-7-phosphoheptulonate synthase, partial [Deltaproteobacteria bacterium]|nr:3-deoxy-7-phosphoheptulonate synthase [Deltaproteobacteria bacterium]